MIFKGNKEITTINSSNKIGDNSEIYKSIPIQAIYRGMVTLYQAVRSCFGSGMWVNTKPWVNDEAWKNN